MSDIKYYLPDGSPVYDSHKDNDISGIVTTVLVIIAVAVLFVIGNLFLKWIGAGFYIIPLPFLK